MVMLGIIICIILLDLAVIWNICRLDLTSAERTKYILIVLLLPIIGVTLFYMMNRKNEIPKWNLSTRLKDRNKRR
ncbi:MAG: hypothetical protein ACRC13_03230 [Tannerellaceae bacterium]